MKPRTDEDYHERLVMLLGHNQSHLEEPLRLEELAHRLLRAGCSYRITRADRVWPVAGHVLRLTQQPISRDT